MREIKFRVFDKNEGMFLVDGLVGTSKGMRVSSVLQRPEDCDPECYTLEPWEWEYSDDDVLMQFTGLKDKNGVEIYDGDIVMYDLGIDNEKPEKYKIIFDSKQCAYFLYPLEDKARLRHFTYSAKNDCEVIGNIYENTELLESK